MHIKYENSTELHCGPVELSASWTLPNLEWLCAFAHVLLHTDCLLLTGINTYAFFQTQLK